MDSQKIAEQVKFLGSLVKNPRKDKKVIASDLRKIAQLLENEEVEGEEEESPEFQEYRKLLTRLKTKDGINKLKIFIDNPRLRKPIRWWLMNIDKGTGAGVMDFNEMLRKIKILLQRDLPAAKFLKMILDFGVTNGFIALNRILEKDRARITIMREEGVA